MPQTVSTTTGEVRGETHEGYSVFRGIPYAAPPIGALRFAPPQPPTPWRVTRDALTFAPHAPQLDSAMESHLNGGPVHYDEATSLALNVWTPATNDERRPVMVWIHGGGFQWGVSSSPWYDGRWFARDQDVVLVSCNYRLGATGFTYLGHVDDAFAGSGSLGVQDVVAALTWVRDNVARFGGDPDNVTIFGESAGAMAVGTLLGLPIARGLFHKAILQSGAASHVATPQRAAGVTDSLRHALAQPEATVATLQQVDIAALLAAYEQVTKSFPGPGLPAVPVVDGVVLPRAPLASVAAGEAASIPLLIGTTLDEFRLFAMGNRRIKQLSDATLDGALRDLGLDDPAAATAIYRDRLGADASASDVYIAAMTDAMFRGPAIALADAQVAAGGTAYVYRFDWASPMGGGTLGACHALELPFVFNSLDLVAPNALCGPTPPRELASAMHAAWANFARTGAPQSPFGSWPSYDEGRATMLIDEHAHVERDPLSDERQLWQRR